MSEADQKAALRMHSEVHSEHAQMMAADYFGESPDNADTDGMVAKASMIIEEIMRTSRREDHEEKEND